FEARAWHGAETFRAPGPASAIEQGGQRPSPAGDGAAAAARTGVQADLRESPQRESLHRSGRQGRRLIATSPPARGGGEGGLRRLLRAGADRPFREAIAMPRRMI